MANFWNVRKAQDDKQASLMVNVCYGILSRLRGVNERAIESNGTGKEV